MKKKKYPGILSAVLLCLLLLALQFVFGLVLGVYVYLEKILAGSDWYIVGLLVTQVLAFALVAYVGYRKARRSASLVFGVNPVSRTIVLLTILLSFGMVIVTSEIDNVVRALIPSASFMDDYLKEVMSAGSFPLALIFIALVPALTEEPLFRGLFLNGFTRNYSIRTSIIVSAVLFGVIHLNPTQSISAFFIGVCFAWISLRTGSIVPSMIMHFLNNGLYLVTSRFPGTVPIPGFNMYNASFQPWWFTGCGVAVSALGIYLIARQTHPIVRPAEEIVEVKEIPVAEQV